MLRLPPQQEGAFPLSATFEHMAIIARRFKSGRYLAITGKRAGREGVSCGEDGRRRLKRNLDHVRPEHAATVISRIQAR